MADFPTLISKLERDNIDCGGARIRRLLTELKTAKAILICIRARKDARTG
jgi:hypothetical protein